MKYLCLQCNKYMDYESQEVLGGLSLAISFVCAECGIRIALVTNPGETQLVEALGVTIGGRTVQPKPLELTQAKLVEKRETVVGEPQWSAEALKRMERIPAFVRPMVRKNIESYARRKGYQEITPEILDEVREETGFSMSIDE